MSDERFIESPPEGIEGWRDVWSRDLQVRSGQPSAFIRFIDSVLDAITRPFLRRVLRRQRDFNIVLLDLLRDTNKRIDDLRRDIQSDLAAQKQDIRGDIDQVTRDLMGALQNAEAGLKSDIARIDQLIPIASKRADALTAAVDRKVESVAARVRDLTTPVLAPDEARTTQSDFVYRRLEESLRGGETEVRDAVSGWMPFVEGPAVDLGCGRGEFLAACRDKGIAATGFDSNERSVADLKSRGFDVHLGSIPQCLTTIADGWLRTVFASHVVEHLTFDTLLQLFSEARRVLATDGTFLIETPNAESMMMAAGDFWRDPTHLAPRPVAALLTIAREFGFELLDASTSAPYPEAEKFDVSKIQSAELRDVASRLNAILFGDQNLRLALRKR